jgi:DNA-binding MarR family transcriptional regulator
LRARRARCQFFDAELFADPAWDMLLELFAAERGQHKISVSSLCVGSNVPATTALRWIQTLEKRHLLRRVGDPLDGRRFFVSLTEKGSRAMTAYFQAVKLRPNR